MNVWLEPRAFWIAFSLMAFAQFSKVMQQTGWGIGEVILALTTSIIGGVFWGAIGTYVYRKFYKKP
jgi:hypothetical protein